MSIRRSFYVLIVLISFSVQVTLSSIAKDPESPENFDENEENLNREKDGGANVAVRNVGDNNKDINKPMESLANENDQSNDEDINDNNDDDDDEIGEPERQVEDVKRRHGNQSEIQHRVRHHHHHHHHQHHHHQDVLEGNADKEQTKEVIDVDEAKVIDSDNVTQTVVNGSEPSEDGKCVHCDSKQTEEFYRIEKVKAQLLQKLGLSEPPEVDGPIHPLPDDFYIGENFANDEPDEEEDDDRLFKAKTREIFLFGEDVTNLCLKKRGAGCYSFNLTNKGIYAEDINSVELWIYKQADLNDHHIQTFVVSELSKHQRRGKEYLRSRNIVKRVETRLKYGWMKIYVNRMVLRWLSKPHRNNGLAVVCKTCKRKYHKTIFGVKEGLMPFLVFYMRRRGHSLRSKRETRCLEGGNNCCHRESLEINFRDIGWDYIMAPPSIRPNYCTGSCNGIHAAYYNHTRLVQTLQQSVMHDFTPLQPCCSPVHFRRTQSLLYRDHQRVIRKIDIPDLIVGECGCT